MRTHTYRAQVVPSHSCLMPYDLCLEPYAWWRRTAAAATQGTSLHRGALCLMPYFFKKNTCHSGNISFKYAPSILTRAAPMRPPPPAPSPPPPAECDFPSTPVTFRQSAEKGGAKCLSRRPAVKIACYVDIILSCLCLRSKRPLLRSAIYIV